MNSLYLQISPAKTAPYQWLLYKDSSNHPLADGIADIEPDTVITYANKSFTLSELFENLVDYQNKTKWLSEYFDDSKQLHLGHFLYEQTLGQCEARLPDLGSKVELIVITTDPFIQQLPWTILSRDKRSFLIMDDWTINLATKRVNLPITFAEVPSLLVICPEPESRHFPSTQGRLHAEDLQRSLATYSRALDSPKYFSLAETWDECVQRLQSQHWDMVYFYGHSKGGEHGSQLVFANKDGQAELYSVMALAKLLKKSPPDVLYINACQSGSLSAAGAANQLGECVPALVVNRTDALISDAKKQASVFFHALQQYYPPHEALAEAYRTSSAKMTSTSWMTPLLFQHYVKWTFVDSNTQQLSEHDPNWRLRLDRFDQTAQLRARVSDMMKFKHPLAMFCFWFGGQGQGVELYHDRIPVEIEDGGISVVSRSFRWPECFDDFDCNFEQMILDGLSTDKIRRLDMIHKVLDQHQSSNKKVLLHCRFKTLRLPPHGHVYLEHIEEFLFWWNDRMMPILREHKMSVILAVGYELDKEIPTFANDVQEEFEKRPMDDDFMPLLLPELPAINDEHVIEFLKLKVKNLRFDDAKQRKRFVQDLLKKNKVEGNYEKTLRILQTVVASAYRFKRSDKPEPPKTPKPY